MICHILSGVMEQDGVSSPGPAESALRPQVALAYVYVSVRRAVLTFKRGLCHGSDVAR